MFARKLDVIFETIRGGDGRSIIAMVGLNGLNFLLCNLYTPNLDNPEFFSIFNKIQNLNCEQRIIAGDFNQVLYTILDRKGGAIIQMEASKYINSFLNENEWVDLGDCFMKTCFSLHGIEQNQLLCQDSIIS